MQARDPLLVGLGQAIKELRKQRGLNQEELAYKEGAHRRRSASSIPLAAASAKAPMTTEGALSSGRSSASSSALASGSSASG